uniref:Zinc transporter ZIP11 n=1 Tax=Strigamia maritima TaxID=126957 RepID=T1J9H6_STRMM
MASSAWYFVYMVFNRCRSWFGFCIQDTSILDLSLGFAAGVMTAASYWSLLEPAIETAKESKNYGNEGEYAFFPASAGFLFGAIFVFATDRYINYLVSVPENNDFNIARTNVIQRKKVDVNCDNEKLFADQLPTKDSCEINWQRILMLLIAITRDLLLALGLQLLGNRIIRHLRKLAIGIGIQNFPEGLAVSLPLRGAGYGQLSGLVEPIAGVFGALIVTAIQPILPYALGFAAGAMIYVVVDDIIPEAQTCGNGKYASWGAVFDVGLG